MSKTLIKFLITAVLAILKKVRIRKKEVDADDERTD